MICQEAFMASDWAASFSANKREHHGTLASTGTDPQALTLFLQPFRLGAGDFFPWQPPVPESALVAKLSHNQKVPFPRNFCCDIWYKKK
jgi:hypothetical protein